MAETTTITTASANGAPPDATDKTVTALPPAATPQPAPPPSTRPPRTPFHQIHALPVPIRTFPLPTFFPNNPISLVHLVWAWVRQVVSPPAAEPSTVHIGVWDPVTGSVHVNDPKSIRVLWEQGFFGKGTLSRSEPNWMKRELGRRGTSRAGNVSEERTEARREERRMAKWERARTELEAIEQQRQEEARLDDAPTAEVADEHQPVEGPPVPEQVQLSAEPEEVSEEPAHVAPVHKIAAVSTFEGARPPTGPAELLALPNSLLDLIRDPSTTFIFETSKPPVGPAELLALPNSQADLPSKTDTTMEPPQDDKAALSQAPLGASLPPVNGLANGVLVNGHAKSNGTAKDELVMTTEASASEPSTNISTVSQANGTTPSISSSLPSSESISASTAQGNGSQPPPTKRRKSVRFSPDVESTTFQRFDPPRSTPDGLPKTTDEVANGNANGSVPLPALPTPEPTPDPVPVASTPVLEAAVNITEIPNKEQFQLAPEEAFFLVFAMGVLSVVDPVTLAPIPTDKLLTLFRAQSHFPPQQVGLPLQPQDPFLVNYAVYHHFRSLGWVPRHGIKFGVDWILYQRGPVFDHSEFGIMVLPSFSDKHWKDTKFEAPRRSWSWLMGVNRVLSHVLKALVLVYVDVPSPAAFDEAMSQGGIAAALEKYTIREVMVRRFSVNRNR